MPILSFNISCMPVNALMAIVHMLSGDNNKLHHMWSLVGTLQSGNLKKNTFVRNQKGTEETFIHSVIHLLILSGSQSVSQ